MAIRYVRQNDNSSCGPIAIINTLKWLGNQEASYQLLPLFRKLCHCTRSPGGTTPRHLGEVLMQQNIKYSHMPWPTLEIVNKHLDLGDAVLLKYVYGTSNGHYALCIGRTTKYYTVVNMLPGKTISKCHVNTMDKMLHHMMPPHTPQCWFIAGSTP